MIVHRDLSAEDLRRTDGTPVDLVQRLGGGGEGTVFVAGEEQVVKVFKTIDADLGKRLETLIAMRNDRLARIAAWPTAIVVDEEGRAVGFEMRRIRQAHPLYCAYQVRTRLQLGLGKDWRFSVRVAANLAAAVHQVHEAGLVVGDLNESNVLVDASAMVNLIDVDSFQVPVGTRVHTCNVGKGELIAPELQGRSLQGLIRSPHHDAFSLAVLIFQLLMLGRHPFAGRPREDRDVTLEEAIAQRWYPYATESGPLAPPPHMDTRWLPAAVREAFELAFLGSPDDRPSAQRWFALLKDLEAGLVACPSHARHLYPAQSEDCPWCRIERACGATLFGGSNVDEPAWDLGIVDDDLEIDALLAQVEAISIPRFEAWPAIPDVEMIAAEAPPGAVKRQVRWILGYAAFAFITGTFLIARFGKNVMPEIYFLVFPFKLLAYGAASPRTRRLKKESDRLRGRLQAATMGTLEARRNALLEQRQHFVGVHRKLRDLGDRAEQLRLAALGREHGAELLAYLRRFGLATADVHDLTGKEVIRLRNQNIVTAADLTVESLRGRCHEPLRTDLLNWRLSLERHYLVSKALRSSHTTNLQIRAQVMAEREALLAELRSAPARWAAAVERADTSHDLVRGLVEQDVERYIAVTAEWKWRIGT